MGVVIGRSRIRAKNMQLYSHHDYESLNFARIDHWSAMYVSNYEA